MVQLLLWFWDHDSVRFLVQRENEMPTVFVVHVCLFNKIQSVGIPESIYDHESYNA